MESIPLLCKICPKQPHFSDISHLLTHISSKGHLAHYFNAQVRSRKSASIRFQLEEYDDWYDKNQIENLLSKRLAQKDTKKADGNCKHPKINGTMPVKKERTNQRPAEESTAQDYLAMSDSKDAIDPQLSLSAAGFDGDMSLQSQSHAQGGLPPLDSVSLHRTRASRNRASTLVHPQPRKLTLGDLSAPDSLMENNQEFWPESTRNMPPLYPDPSGLDNYSNYAPTTTPKPVSVQARVSSPSMRSSSNDRSPTAGEPGATHFLKLKGPQYPGMALFDSASPKSQRQRNQKKEHSLLAQMEYNAAIVEPIEQIYFPEWTLKKARPITGDVESSPIQETSPKPKRRRGKPGKAILRELSTNAPLTKGSQTVSKPKNHDFKEREPILDDPFTNYATLSGAIDASIGFQNASTLEDEDALEWRLNKGLTRSNSPKRFSVFSDSASIAPQQLHEIGETRHRPFDNPLRGSSLASTSHSPNIAFLDRRNNLPLHFGSSPSMGRAGAFAMQHLANDQRAEDFMSGGGTWYAEKENVEPLFDNAGHIDDEASRIRPERSTQRYFSVVGDEPPQFFNSLPSELDFGGFVEQRPWGTYLNPLNVVARQHRYNFPHHGPSHPGHIHLCQNQSSGETPKALSRLETPTLPDDLRSKVGRKGTRPRK